MHDLDPLWIGLGGTALAVAVFANGYRLFRQDGVRGRMGLFHMILAPAFVAMLWAVLISSGALS